MAGRRAPIEILQASGKKHLTKKEIANRKESEIKLDLAKLESPTFVKNDVAAFRYWQKHLKEYKEAAKQGIEVLASSDVGMLAIPEYKTAEEVVKGVMASPDTWMQRLKDIPNFDAYTMKIVKKMRGE